MTLFTEIDFDFVFRSAHDKVMWVSVKTKEKSFINFGELARLVMTAKENGKRVGRAVCEIDPHFPRCMTVIGYLEI